MGKIVLLDDLTINQIAAGEVIERPASVVKELVENSIDAGSKNVTVEIKNGGISYIRVTDDGSGIMPDDMEIAFERHATSKIRSADDLDEVKSMGFRGEALASIASIASVELVSKTADKEIGYKIIAKGGKIVDKHEEGAQKGTTITVQELFFNTPVRYKFLKKDFTESGYIEDAITRIALANPGVAIKLINTGKTVIQTNGSGKIEDCIYSIYGKEIYDNILPVDYQYENYHISGVIGKPIISRSNRSNQLFFVNNRFVKDKTLTSAAEQAFKGLVTIGKHGFLILNIDMDPKLVDVNVHPTKLEVRFQEESKLFKAIYHSIKETLLGSDLISDPVKDYSDATPNDILKGITNRDRVEAWKLNKEEPKQEFKVEKKPEFNEFKNTMTKLDSDTRVKFMDEISKAKTSDEITKQIGKLTDLINENKVSTENNEIEEVVQEKQPEIEHKEEIKIEVEENKAEEPIVKEKEEKYFSEDTVEVPETKVEDSEIKETVKEKIVKEPKEEEKQSFEEMYKKLFGRDIETAKKEYQDELERKEEQYPVSPISNNEVSLFEIEGEQNIPYQFVGIAFRTYIILTMNDELYIMDQHAAHERIMYEKVKANYYSQGEKDSQLMLLPDIINLNNKEMGIFRDNKEMFERAGFMVEEFGDNTVKLTGVPEFCLDFDNKEIFLETLDEIDTVARTAKQELENKFLATVACKAAVKAHMALSKEEVDSLMKQLLKLPNPFSCPHGRPTVIKMSKTDIEKKFSRR